MSGFGLHQPARGNSFFANFALLELYSRSELDTVPGRSGVLLNSTYDRLLTFADQKTSNTLLLGFYDFPWPHLDNGSIGGSNDNFTNSIRLEGTNITVAGNGANATLENSGSDLLGQDRLVFLGGAVHEPCKLHDVPTYAGESVSVFTGPAVDHLQRLPRVQYAENAFVGIEGTIYHIQVDTTGYGDDFSLALSATPLPIAGNDSFSNAFVMKG